MYVEAPDNPKQPTTEKKKPNRPDNAGSHANWSVQVRLQGLQPLGSHVHPSSTKMHYSWSIDLGNSILMHASLHFSLRLVVLRELEGGQSDPHVIFTSASFPPHRPRS